MSPSPSLSNMCYAEICFWGEVEMAASLGLSCHIDHWCSSHGHMNSYLLAACIRPVLNETS